MDKPQPQDGSAGNIGYQQIAYPEQEEAVFLVNEPTRWRRFLASIGKAMIELGENVKSWGNYDIPFTENTRLEVKADGQVHPK